MALVELGCGDSSTESGSDTIKAAPEVVNFNKLRSIRMA